MYLLVLSGREIKISYMLITACNQEISSIENRHSLVVVWALTENAAFQLLLYKKLHLGEKIYIDEDKLGIADCVSQ